MELLDLYALLLRSTLSADDRPVVPGAKLFLLLVFWNEVRFTDDVPISARFVPEDDRWNWGWFGRGGANEVRDPEIDRT